MNALPTEESGKLHNVDLLRRPIINAGFGVDRDGSKLIARKPWAEAHFGKLSLAAGWWRLCVQGEKMSGVAELILRSPLDPYISVPLEQAQDIRLLLRGGDPFDVSLLVSYWPSKFEYSKISFERLTLIEAAGLMLRRFISLLRSDNALKRLFIAAKKFLLGGSIGTRYHAAPNVDAQPVTIQQASADGSEFTIIDIGALCVLLRKGDELHPAAKDIVEAEFASSVDVRMIYADTLEGDRIIPKPEWDALLARTHNYIDTPLFVKSIDRSILERTHPLSQCGDSSMITRIALPLARRPAIIRAKIGSATIAPVVDSPLVSILIPTKFRTDLLEKCLTSLHERTGYLRKEVVIVDNGSADPRFGAVVEAARLNMPVVTLRDANEFNFSRLMNLAVSHASGDLVLLFNDDIEALQPDWLDRLVSSALNDDVGIVGARLVYPDMSIQHAGVAVGIGGVCGHLWKNAPSSEAESNPFIVCAGQRTAVTGACLMMKRSAYLSIGGMDLAFPINYGDIDLCLRVRREGLKVIYRGDACLIHHESKSTGTELANYERAKVDTHSQREFVRRWGSTLWRDPFASPAFDPQSEKGDVRTGLTRSLGSYAM